MSLIFRELKSSLSEKRDQTDIIVIKTVKISWLKFAYKI